MLLLSSYKPVGWIILTFWYKLICLKYVGWVLVGIRCCVDRISSPLTRYLLTLPYVMSACRIHSHIHADNSRTRSKIFFPYLWIVLRKERSFSTLHVWNIIWRKTISVEHDTQSRRRKIDQHLYRAKSNNKGTISIINLTYVSFQDILFVHSRFFILTV
jgi:hypothetical protein